MSEIVDEVATLIYTAPVIMLKKMTCIFAKVLKI